MIEGKQINPRQLIFFLDDGPGKGWPSGSFRERLPSGNPFSTSEIWWESAAKLKKIVSLVLTRDGSQRPTLEVWTVYESDGATIRETVSDVISYTGAFETTRTRTIT